MRFAAQALLGLATLAAVPTAAQAVTIVQYQQTSGEPSLALTNSGTSYSLSSIGTQRVSVTLFDPNDINNTAVVDARFNFSAYADQPAALLGNSIFQEFEGGVFSLTALAPFSFLSETGTNILAGAFSKGTLFGELGGRAASVSVSTPTSSFVAVSDFFSSQRQELTNFSFGLSDASGGLRVAADGWLRNFTASSVGTFGATSTVPEVEAWAMLMMGFGMVGFAARYRRRTRYLTS